MAKITLAPVTNTDMLSTINQNFDDLEAEFQDKVLYRANPVDETNTMTNLLDMNGQRIINLPVPGSPNDAARLQDVVNATTGIVPASAIPYSPSGFIAATNVQGAIDELASDISNTTSSTQGAALLGYKASFVGAVGRTLASRLEDRKSAADFGLLPTNNGAQNAVAWAKIETYTSTNPCTIHIPAGNYVFDASISFNSSNTRLSGDGIDATILTCTFPTGDFITQTGTKFYQTIDNLTITSSVTRTSGSMFTSGFWKRGLMYRVKISKHFTGIFLPQFEQCSLVETNIVSPTGAGTALIAGTPSASNTGANLNVFDCFIRGNDETIPGSAAVGSFGYQLFDIQAIFSINTDISTFINHCCQIAPQTQIGNCYFLMTYFDNTVTGNNVDVRGTGEKISLTFTSCWFAGAGNAGATSPNAYGVLLENEGTYRDIVISAGRFITTSASGLYVLTPNMEVNLTGNTFINCGFHASSTNRDAILASPAVGANRTLNIVGNLFDVSGGFDVRLGNANATGRVNISGNSFSKGVSAPDGTYWGNVSGNIDFTKSPLATNLASASTIVPTPCYNYQVVSGTTNINRIQVTYPGHQLTLRFLDALTVTDDASNLRLVGNLITDSNTMLTLICEANGDWREITRSVT